MGRKTNLNSKLLKTTAIEAALAGGRVLRKHFGKPLKIQEKARANLVSNADLEAEKAIIGILKRRLKNAAPEMGFLAEESGQIGIPQDQWILDPLDGTHNFIHGFPNFCVSLAAKLKGEIVLGVIYQPLTKELYVAEKGRGALLNGKKIKVSKTQFLVDSLLTTGFSYHRGDLSKEVQAFERISAETLGIRRPGSAAMDLAYVARGVFDGYWERHLSPWDVAAGILLVREAGGVVTDFSGTSSQVHDRQILAANPKVHTQLLKILSPS